MPPKKRTAPGLLKQGNLFTFFSKKAKTTPSTQSSQNSADKVLKTKSTGTTKAASTHKDKAPSSPTHKNWNKLQIGMRVSVYWPDDEKYYDCKITKSRQVDSAFFLQYDDGDTEWLDLRQEKFRIIEKSPKQGSKRRQIQDDDEENEFEMGDENDEENSSESEESEYVQEKQIVSDDDDDDDDDDQWMVTDDEDDEHMVASASKSNKSKKKLVKVTRHKEAPVPDAPKVTPKASRTSKALNQTSDTGTCTDSTNVPLTRVTPTSSVDTMVSSPMLKKQATQRSIAMPAKPIKSVSAGKSRLPVHTSSTTGNASCHNPTTNNSKSPLPYVKGAVNPVGSHVHNHLPFLQNPRDRQGRAPDHPEYDPRTLKVVHSDWDLHGSKMTAAVKQWWDIKSQYFDTVLLFKTGKFYEMFHMDADIGVQVLGFNYMKGHVAHAGFPEPAYGGFANKLVLAGYKVARVEQTETPEMLKERKKKIRGSNSPKVVNREVCSILTLGTRTFCYLDKGLTQEIDATGGTVPAGTGPLLAIREFLLDDMQEVHDPDSVTPVCEYGVTIVDTIRGIVTIGQFADDILRSRMNTLLTAFAPSEILIEGGVKGASSTLQSLMRSVQTTLPSNALRIEKINSVESFPKSTALDAKVRQSIERKMGKIHPWDASETLDELHRRGYYPRASREVQEKPSTSRWPQILHAAVEGGANLALSSFGAALFYLQRGLIDEEILSMGIVKAYVPPTSSTSSEQSPGPMTKLAVEQDREEDGLVANATPDAMDIGQYESLNLERDINHMALDGTTLHNLEILTNAMDHKVKGSLWSKINYTKTPHGSRLLRAWLLRPLFRKTDIDRRADAVEELVSGAPAAALSEAVSVLAKCGDIERLLSRVHSMSGAGSTNESSPHPNTRAVLYETGIYTKRKVNDFSKVMNGLRQASKIPELFTGMDINSGLLQKVVRYPDEGGCFPLMTQELDWFFENFDADLAAKGLFGPSRGMDEAYDDACDTVERIISDLNDFQNEMCGSALSPRALAKSSWRYINTKPDSKDKYLIELPANISVPDDFILKGKRGSGRKQINKYRAQLVEQLVKELEVAFDVQKERKARGMQLIFAKFDSKRTLWEAAAHATALLDALGSLARTATKAGYSRPKILDCPLDSDPSIRVIQGRHPCVESTPNSGEFIPNDLSLGVRSGESEEDGSSKVLLLSGPNMGGKSTLLRQTCLITIMAQIGSYVPAVECDITPIDRIYTRLGASDRILLGQSTFFVELAETAAALRGATRRSLVIMDELGRGTSTFDGTAIASATVKHLVERSKCLSLFATHYHSLLDDWKDNPHVRLGHMECIVDGNRDDGNELESEDAAGDDSITFLYTLGDGVCPKSFGINVARLASLPEDVLTRAKRVSSDFEQKMNINNAVRQKQLIIEKIRANDWEGVEKIWLALQ